MNKPEQLEVPDAKIDLESLVNLDISQAITVCSVLIKDVQGHADLERGERENLLYVLEGQLSKIEASVRAFVDQN